MSTKPIDTHSQKCQQSHIQPDSQSTTTNDGGDEQPDRKSIETNTDSITAPTPTSDDSKQQSKAPAIQQPPPNERVKEHKDHHDKFQPIKMMKQKFTFTANRARKKRSNI